MDFLDADDDVPTSMTTITTPTDGDGGGLSFLRPAATPQNGVLSPSRLTWGNETVSAAPQPVVELSTEEKEREQQLLESAAENLLNA